MAVTPSRAQGQRAACELVPAATAHTAGRLREPDEVAFVPVFSRLRRQKVQQNRVAGSRLAPVRVSPFPARRNSSWCSDMAFSIYDASIPPMLRMLESMMKILAKARREADERGIALADLVEARLAPDMHPFPRQIQIMSDTAKGCAARLAGIEAPSFPDTETTFPELETRIAKTVEFLKSVPADKLAGAEDRTVTLKFPQGEMSFTGKDYVAHFAMPNFYFHATTAYDLLRHKGIQIGKRDYLGGV